MFKPRNPILLRDGYAPAGDVARALDKNLSTVHRMLKDGRVAGTKDGAAHYVKLDALMAYFRSEGNDSLAGEVMKLKAALLAEARTRLAHAPAAPRARGGAR